MADASITGLEDAPDPLVGAWYLPIAQQGLRSRRILYTDLISASSSWAAITGTPTTLAGYGIADAVPASAISAYGLTLVDDANAAAARTTLGLGNVDNTSDANKPVSSAQQTALNLKADTSSLGDLALLDTVGTPQINNDAVTYAKIQNVSAATRLLGRGSAAGAGDVEELTVSTGLSLSGTVLTATIAAANPTGTIGLAAVNGSAATFLRSDGAPALSQAIVPTWTGLHTFTTTAGGTLFTGSAGYTVPGGVNGLISGGGDSLTQILQVATSAHATLPETARQALMFSTHGSATPSASFKIADFVMAVGSAGSADIYGQIAIAHAAATFPTGNTVIAAEDDLNVLNAHYGDTAGAPTAPYAFCRYMAVGGDKRATGGLGFNLAAYGGVGAALNRGIVFWGGTIRLNTIEDHTTNTTGSILAATGTKHIGINLQAATFDDAAFISPLAMIDNGGRSALGFSSLIGTEALRVRQTTDQNIQFRGPITLGDGTSLTSVDDTGATTKGIEVLASTIFLNAGTVRFGTKTGAADAASDGFVTITDAAGNTVKLATRA